MTWRQEIPASEERGGGPEEGGEAKGAEDEGQLVDGESEAAEQAGSVHHRSISVDRIWRIV